MNLLTKHGKIKKLKNAIHNLQIDEIKNSSIDEIKELFKLDKSLINQQYKLFYPDRTYPEISLTYPIVEIYRNNYKNDHKIQNFIIELIKNHKLDINKQCDYYFIIDGFYTMYKHRWKEFSLSIKRDMCYRRTDILLSQLIYDSKCRLIKLLFDERKNIYVHHPGLMENLFTTYASNESIIKCECNRDIVNKVILNYNFECFEDIIIHFVKNGYDYNKIIYVSDWAIEKLNLLGFTKKYELKRVLEFIKIIEQEKYDILLRTFVKDIINVIVKY